MLGAIVGIAVGELVGSRIPQLQVSYRATHNYLTPGHWDFESIEAHRTTGTHARWALP